MNTKHSTVPKRIVIFIRSCLRACLKTVASAILADVELGFQPGGKDFETTKDPLKFEWLHNVGAFPGGKMPLSPAGREARRYSPNRLYKK